MDSIKQVSSRLLSPMQQFFDFFRGKYTGVIVSVLFVILFTYMFHGLVIQDLTKRTPSKIFLIKSVQTWFVLLLIVILVQFFTHLL